MGTNGSKKNCGTNVTRFGLFFFFTRKGDDPENLRFIEYHKLKIINFINLTK